MLVFPSTAPGSFHMHCLNRSPTVQLCWNRSVRGSQLCKMPWATLMSLTLKSSTAVPFRMLKWGWGWDAHCATADTMHQIVSNCVFVVCKTMLPYRSLVMSLGCAALFIYVCDLCVPRVSSAYSTPTCAHSWSSHHCKAEFVPERRQRLRTHCDKIITELLGYMI